VFEIAAVQVLIEVFLVYWFSGRGLDDMFLEGDASVVVLVVVHVGELLLEFLGDVGLDDFGLVDQDGASLGLAPAQV